jgi:thiaminase/transcriptional activator TenA
MSERFTDELRRRANPIWEAQHRHPFVLGVGDGSLDVEKFNVWLRQDYLYLIEYARLFALGAARSPDLETMTWMVQMADGVLGGEMKLHRSYAVEFGISADELEAGVKLPTTQAYTDFLLRVAATGSFEELVAALLPCVWGYWEIGARLQQHQPADERYARWVVMYSGEVAAQLAQRARDLMDLLAAGLPERALRGAREAFLTSSRYEWRFWEMAWAGETWDAGSVPGGTDAPIA